MSSVRSWTETTEPKDHTDIYRYVQQKLDEFSALIDDYENDYYRSVISNNTNRFKRPLPVHTLTSWGKLLNEFITSGAARSISNTKSMRDLLAQSKAGSTLANVTEDHIIVMQRILEKNADQLENKIPNLAGRIKSCLRIMEQYFLSFYEIPNIQEYIANKKKEVAPDEYIETPYVYERSRVLHIYQVNKSLKILHEMKQRTEDPRGIGLTTLSKECQELALRCNGTSLSLIYALPECYIEARRLIAALRTWLTQDTQYLSFIESSLATLEDKSLESSKAFEFSRIHLSQVEHRLTSSQNRLEKLKEEDEVNEKQRLELEDRLSDKERDYLSKRLTYEVYEDQLKKLLQSSDRNGDEFDQTLSIEKFQAEVTHLSRELPKLNNQIKKMQNRLKYFEERKCELAEMKKECDKLEKEVQHALEDRLLKENHYTRVNDARKLLQRIQKSRARNDLAKKIFHKLPLDSERGTTNTKDDLSKAMGLTAKNIGRDWNRLYWNLPFYPARGKQEMAKDINSIDDKYHRGDVFHEQAKDALNKWRRFHTRAKLDDILEALEKIRRFDILQDIDRQIIKPKLLLNQIPEVVDARKAEIEDLNRKLNTLFEKLRTGVITTHDTYVYSSIGLDPLKPYLKRKRNNYAKSGVTTSTESSRM